MTCSDALPSSPAQNRHAAHAFEGGDLVLQIVSADDWFTSAREFSDLSYRQCPAYATRSASTTRSTLEFVLLTRSDVGVVGACAVRVKKLPGLPLGVAYIHHGPLTLRSKIFDPNVFQKCLEALARHYVGERKLTLRIQPPNAAAVLNPDFDGLFKAAGFQRGSRAPRRTIIVAGDRPLPELRKKLNPKWRNKLTQSEKIDLRIVATQDPTQFQAMAPLLGALEQRKSFRAAQGISFFADVQKMANNFEKLTLYLGYIQDRLVSAHLCATAGPGVESILAATNDEGHHTRASHLMQWQVIMDMLTARKDWYDLGGIDPDANPGVYRFKSGMGGVEFSEFATFELAPNGILSCAIGVAEKIYRSTLRSRRLS